MVLKGSVNFGPRGSTALGFGGHAHRAFPLMTAVLSASKTILEHAESKKSKDLLLDKFTLRYYKYIDLKAALDWFKEMDNQ